MRFQLATKIPQLLRDAPFRRYWTGQSLSLLGDEIGGLALPLTAVIVLHASAQAMGMLNALGSLPALFFAISAGAWVDRWGRRRHVMIAADIGRAAVLAWIPAAYLLGRLSLAGMMIAVFLVGTFSVLFRVSSSTLFVSLAPQERYVEANSLLQGSRAVAFLTGPGIGGFLIQLLSAPVAILADALSFVASAASLAWIHPVEPPSAPMQPRHTSAGLRFVWASSVLRPLLAATAAINLFRAVFFALFVLYATRTCHVTPAEWGVILGPGSVGALFGSALAGRMTERVGLGLTFLVGAVVYTAPRMLVPLAGGSHLTAVSFLLLEECLSGMGLMVLETSKGAILAAAIPDHLRARVGGAMEFVSRGLGPLGALLGGVLSIALGVRLTLWVATLGGTLGALWLLSSPLVRLRRVSDFLPEAG